MKDRIDVLNLGMRLMCDQDGLPESAFAVRKELLEEEFDYHFLH
jgi:hypothetical protein